MRLRRKHSCIPRKIFASWNLSIPYRKSVNFSECLDRCSCTDILSFSTSIPHDITTPQLHSLVSQKLTCFSRCTAPEFHSPASTQQSKCVLPHSLESTP